MAVDTLPMDFGRDKRFYVYIYRDPRKGKKNQPIYVGKGTRMHNRADVHWKRRSHNGFLAAILDKIRASGLEPTIEIVGWFDDEDDAYSCEAELIKRIGRRNLGEGPLTNLIDKDAAPTRVVRSDDFRKSKSKLMKRLAKEFWADAEIREKMLSGAAAYTKTEKFKREKSELTKRLWGDEGHRHMRINRMKEAAANPRRRAALVDMITAAAGSPKAKERARKSGLARRKWWWLLDGKKYETPQELANILGVTEATIRWRAKHGYIETIPRQAHNEGIQNL